jgi:hypothetical protein
VVGARSRLIPHNNSGMPSRLRESQFEQQSAVPRPEWKPTSIGGGERNTSKRQSRQRSSPPSPSPSPSPDPVRPSTTSTPESPAGANGASRDKGGRVELVLTEEGVERLVSLLG